MAETRESHRAQPSEEARARTVTVDRRAAQCGASVTYTVQRSLRAPAEARRFVEEHVCPQHDTLATAAIALVASEVVTHAALRGEGPITIVLDCGVTSLTLRVSCSSVLPEEAGELRLGDPISSMIVDSICRASGTWRTENGSTMWCTIPTGYMPEPVSREVGTSVGTQPVSRRPPTIRTLGEWSPYGSSPLAGVARAGDKRA